MTQISKTISREFNNNNNNTDRLLKAVGRNRGEHVARRPRRGVAGGRPPVPSPKVCVVKGVHTY